MNASALEGGRIVFEHLPKTAGLSIVDAFQRYYGKENCFQIVKHKKNKIPSGCKFASGHRAAFYLEKPDNYNYFTFFS